MSQNSAYKIKTTRDIINRGSGMCKITREPIKLLENDVQSTSSKGVVNNFVHYFLDIAMKLTSSLKSSSIGALNILKNKVCHFNHQFKFIYVTPNEVRNVLGNVK